MGEGGTLMFGLGATRSGSTWLYRYLQGHPDCALPHIKELHYFSTLDLGGRDRQMARLEAIQNRAQARIADSEGARRDGARQWADDATRLQALLAAPEEDVPGYLNFLQSGRGGALHGDITPAYALLSEDRLRMMSRLAERVRFVFLLRDPVDRLWSNICQKARNKANRATGSTAPEGRVAALTQKLFDRWLGGIERELTLRSDYKAILTKLRAALPGDTLFVGFYERLFRSETIHRLCAFLGIAFHPADFGRRSNVSDKIAMTPAQRAKARRELAPQYAFVEHFMGGDLPARWIENRMSAPAGEMRV